MNWNLTSSVLPLYRQNVSISNRLDHLFIDEWSTQANYAKYFSVCTPSRCTYTLTNEVNLSYTITFLLSLYGSLIIILRFIATSLVNGAFRIKHRRTNINIDAGIF